MGFDWHYTHHRIGWSDAGGPLRAAGVQEGLEFVADRYIADMCIVVGVGIGTG